MLLFLTLTHHANMAGMMSIANRRLQNQPKGNSVANLKNYWCKKCSEPLEVNLSDKYQEFTECGNGTRFFHHTSVIKQNQNKGQNPFENLKTALKVHGWLLYVLPMTVKYCFQNIPPSLFLVNQGDIKTINLVKSNNSSLARWRHTRKEFW